MRTSPTRGRRCARRSTGSRGPADELEPLRPPGIASAKTAGTAASRARALRGPSLVELLLACVGNEALALRLLARKLSCPPYRFGLFPGLALRRLLVSPPLFHFAKQA